MRKLIVFAIVLCLAGTAGAGQSPGQKCQTGKNQESGKYAACLTKAEARLLKTKGACSVTSATVCYGDDDCPMGESCSKDLAKYAAAVTKCEDKFEAKWNKLEETALDKGDVCPDGLLQGEIKDVLDECVGNVADGLAGEGLSSCGDGAIRAGEDCDQANLNGGTCVGEGFAGGVLRCGSGCVYDTSECYTDRFVDNGDGTITDNETRLMWEKKVELGGGVNLGDLQDADNIYIWAGSCSINAGKRCQPDAASSAACFAGVEGDSLGCDECTGGDGVCILGSPGITVWQWVSDLNTANYGGHNDWRMPKRQELQSIVDYLDATPPMVDVAFHGASCGTACTDVTDPACSCTRAFGYWSASTYGLNPLVVWAVFFGDGAVFVTTSVDTNSVRAVRGGS